MSLVDLKKGEVLDEISVGEHPTAILLHPDGKHLLVTSSYSGSLLSIAVESRKLHSVAHIQLGFQPTGLALS
ncbi:MAG: YncE family protein, partial [Planctomycetota bacterium]